MNKFTFLLVFIPAITIVSCQKKDLVPKLIETFYVNESDSVYFPLKNLQKIKYSTPQGIVDFDTWYKNDYLLDYKTAVSDDYYQYQVDLTTFLSKGFVMEYYFRAGSEQPFKMKEISISWASKPDYPEHTNAFWHNFYLPPDSINFDSTIFIIDSIQVNEKWYQQVLKGQVEFFPYPNLSDTIWPTNFYYSNDFGIIKYDMSDGSSWDLINE